MRFASLAHSPRASSWSALVLFVLSPVRTSVAAGGDAPSAGAYTVFLGLDLTLEHERTHCPVVDVADGSVGILYNENTIRLPLEEGNFKTAFSPHLGRSRLEIANLRTLRVDSHAMGRTRDAIAQGFLMESVRAQVQEAAEIKGRNSANDAGVDAARAMGRGENPREANQRSLAALNTVNDAYGAPAFASALPGADLPVSEDTGSGGTFDACEVSFEISSPVEVDDGYGVLRVIVRDPANPRQPAAVIRFFQLSRLGPKPRRVNVALKNLPPGFAVEDCAVHLFAHGREFPTSVSKNRLEVSAEEARQFLVLQYLQQHRLGSRPVAIIPDLLPPGLRTLMGGDVLNATVDLAIDHEGRVTAIHQTQGIATMLTAELEAALRRVCFFPALLNGQPVDGRGTFALSEFVR